MTEATNLFLVVKNLIIFSVERNTNYERSERAISRGLLLD
jgi:hypothetical protein